MASTFADYDPAPLQRRAPFAGTVRVALPGDAEAVARISAQREELPVEEVLPRISAEFADEAFGRTSVLFVAELPDGEIAGFGRARHVGSLDDVPADLRPPAGWYLLGVVVAPAHRRRGVARRLTERRLAFVGERTDVAYYFVRASNQASIDLHADFGFVETSRRFLYPRTGLGPGGGILFRVEFGADAPPSA